MSIDPSTDSASDEPILPPTEPTGGPSTETFDDDEDVMPLNPLVVAAIGLILLAFIPFVASLKADFQWLDDVSITDNPFIRTNDGVARFWTAADPAGRYEPLTLTSYWIEYRLSSLSPVLYYAFNILLHVMSVIFLWTLLRRLDVPGCWVVAAVFAVHPIHVQSVAWISGRAILMSATLYLGAMLVYLRYSGITPVPPGSKTLMTLPSEPERLWGLSLILFVCAMLSHPIAVTFPLTIVFIIWWKRGTVAAKEWLLLSPFLVVGIGISVLAGYLQSIAPSVTALTSAFGKTQPADLIGFAIRAVVVYAGQIIAPIDTIFDYPRFVSSIGAVLISAFVVLLSLFILWILRPRIGRGPFTGAALFVLLLLPILGILDAPSIRYSFVADYRAYPASAALIALIVGCIAYLIQRQARPIQVAGSTLAGVIIFVLLVLSFRVDLNYLTPLKLWGNTVRQNKQSLLAANQYGEAARANANSNARLVEARNWFSRAEKLAPGDPQAKYNLGINDEADAFNARYLGRAEQSAALRKHAEGEFESALAMDSNFSPAALELGDMHAADKDEKGAIAAYRQALAAAPLSLRARLSLAGALRRDKQLDEAEQVLLDSIDIDPKVTAAHTELGNVYLQKQQLQQALDEYAAAVRLDPLNTTVLLNYGAVLDSNGQPDLASKQFLGATKLNPNLGIAFFDLGRVYLKLGRRQDAEIALQKATELNPTDAASQKLLADAITAVKEHGPGTAPSSQPMVGPPFLPHIEVQQ